jgi:hypothetical protein
MKKGMKKTLHLAVTLLCLLTLFIGTASCAYAQLPHAQQASCSDCPTHAPLSQNTPACCTTHQQPSATAASLEVERPALLSHIAAPSFNPSSQSISLPPTYFAEAPPFPPLTPLRI